MNPWLQFYQTPPRRMIINPYAFPTGGGGGPSLITSVATGGTANGVTSGTVDTTGANFIVISVSWYPGSTATGTLSDSKSNTWTSLTLHGSSTLRNQLFYCYAPTVGSGHTFSYNDVLIFPSIALLAFSGIASSPFDQENGSVGSSVSTLATGSITPSQANTVIIAGLSFENNSSGTVTIDSGFSTPVTAAYGGGTNEGASISYLLPGNTSPQNPTWNIANSASTVAASIGNFKF